MNVTFRSFKQPCLQHPKIFSRSEKSVDRSILSTPDSVIYNNTTYRPQIRVQPQCQTIHPSPRNSESVLLSLGLKDSQISQLNIKVHHFNCNVHLCCCKVTAQFRVSLQHSSSGSTCSSVSNEPACHHVVLISAFHFFQAYQCFHFLTIKLLS